MKIDNARISFPNLFRAKAFQDGQDPKFSCTLILPKDHPQLDALKQEIERVAKDKWGEKAPAILKQLKAQGRALLRDGSEKVNESGEYMDGFGEDVLFFNASNSKRPGVFDSDRTPLVEEDGRPYAGCYVNAIVNLWAQDNQYGKRINASLSGVQFYKDGEAFGGGGAPASADDFEDVAEVSDDGGFLD